jgi:soluble cytochrome b562
MILTYITEVIRMATDTYEITINKMKEMEDSDLLLIKEFVDRLSSKSEYRKELYNPYRPYTREEIIEQLEIARKHAYEGKVMDAKQASFNIREKYGL